MPVLAFTAGSLGDILATAGLAARIAKVLYDNKNLEKECEDLAIELRSLQSVLILTEFALERYSSTPLGEPLIHFIRPEVAQCHLSLERYSEVIMNCRQALSTTTISSLWRRVVWAGLDEAAALGAKLSGHRLKLSTLLISLNSARLMVLESVQITKMQAHLFAYANNLSSARRIKDNTIESFHYVVKGYSMRRIGQKYVEQGDYQIVRPESGHIIQHSEFSKCVKEGETVEMSIILRSQKSVDGEERLCPRCWLLNAPSSSEGGWIRCLRCAGQFQSSIHLEDKSNAPIQPKLLESTDPDHDREYDSEGNDSVGSDDRSNKNNVSKTPQRKKIMHHNGLDDEPTQRFSDAKFFRRISLEVYVEATTGKPEKPRFTYAEQIQKFREAMALPGGPSVPQRMYNRFTARDRKRYAEEVPPQQKYSLYSGNGRKQYSEGAVLEDPLYFILDHQQYGIPLQDALHSRTKNLLDRDQVAFQCHGSSVSIRLEWPGYRSWSRQIPTKDFRTIALLAKFVAMCVRRFMLERESLPMGGDTDQRWRIGDGPDDIKLEDLILVSIHHVSLDSWQPHLRLVRPRRAREDHSYTLSVPKRWTPHSSP